MPWTFYTDGGEKVESAVTLDGFTSSDFVKVAGDTMVGALINSFAGATALQLTASTGGVTFGGDASIARSGAAALTVVGSVTMSAILTNSFAGAGALTLSSNSGGVTIGSVGAVTLTRAAPTVLGIGGSAYVDNVIKAREGTSAEVQIGLVTADAGILFGSGADVSLTRTGANLLAMGAGDKLQQNAAPTVGDDLANKTYVDGRFGASGVFVDSEAPTGTIDGVNTVFTIANTPITGSVHVYLNGLRQKVGGGFDYTISGTTITFVTAPLTGSSIIVDYRK